MIAEQDGYRMLVEGLPEPVARLAPDLKIAYVNEALCRRFATRRETLLGRSVLMLVPASDREGLARLLASLDAEHPVGRFEGSGAPSGEEPGGLLWIIRAVHDKVGNLLEYHTLVRNRDGARDVTDHEEADGPLVEIEECFRSVVHNSSEIVKIVELDGTLRYASPAFERILGYDPERALGTNVLDYVHPEDLPHVLKKTERASNETFVYTPVYVSWLNMSQIEISTLVLGSASRTDGCRTSRRPGGRRGPGKGSATGWELAWIGALRPKMSARSYAAYTRQRME